MQTPLSWAPRARPILSYAATFGWAFVAFLAGQIAALAALVWWSHGNLRAVYANPYDGAVVTLSVLALNPVTVAVLVLSVWLKGKSQAEYFALTWPKVRWLTVGVVGILLVIAVTDAFLLVQGHAIVSLFQVISYTTAAAEGWLPAMIIATILVAPAGEEIVFRGYLFRGFVLSERSAWPAIVVISLLWAVPHLQYDWTGIVEIFVAGLFLGWIRWRSGSTLLTFLLHALFNLEGTIETALAVKHVL